MEEVDNGSRHRDASLSARRKRRLEKLEIPEGDVLISDELLGSGGFGEVYIADYCGRNAAAKVTCGWGMHILQICFPLSFSVSLSKTNTIYRCPACADTLQLFLAS